MEFSRKVDQVFEYGAISVAVLAAKEQGIFDVLITADKPVTSHQIADIKKLKERYVREILGSLSSAGLIQVAVDDKGDPVYHLNQDEKDEVNNGALHKFLLLKTLMSQYRSVLACFPVNGPYGCRYNEDFCDYLKEASKGGRDDLRLKNILRYVPGLQARLEQGISVVEFGSGTGHLLNKFAIRFPKSTFTISEVHTTLLDVMKDKWSDVPNMRFEKFDLCQLDLAKVPTKKYDWILTVHVLHDLPHPLTALKNTRRLMNEDGGLYVHYDMTCHGSHVASVGNSKYAMLYACSTFLCLPESFQVEDSEAHGPCWGRDTVVSMLDEAAFDSTVVRLTDDECLYYGGCTKNQAQTD